jgi:hypothetical protein
MRMILAALATITAAVAAPAQVHGQSRGVEVGLGLGHASAQVFRGGDRTVVRSLAASVRAGWHVSDNTALEPGLAAASYDADGARIVSLGVEIGLPYMFGSLYSQQAFYLRPAVGADLLFGSDAAMFDGEAHWNAGLGLGFKLRVAERAALRLEYNARYVFPRNPPREFLRFGGFVGLSFFTR